MASSELSTRALLVAGSALLAACGSESGSSPAGQHSGGNASSMAGTAGSSGTGALGGSGASSGTAGTSNTGTGGTAGTMGSSSGGSAQSGAGGTAGTSAGSPAAGGAGSGSGGVADAGGPSGGRGGRGGRPGTAGDASGAGSAGNPAGTSGSSAGGGSAGASDIPIPDGYTLVWHDEFDVDGPPDPKSWKFEKGFVRNEEDQWYQTANASVSNGILTIEGRKEHFDNPNYTGSGDWKTSRQYVEYTSSSINTSGLQSWQYGRFELRARIPTVSGMWPAWWTLGVSGEWPSNGEIDIMEFYQGKVLANVACGTSTQWQAKWDSATKSLSSLGANWSDDFHVWRMDWDDQSIDLFMDDQSMNTSALSSMLNADGTSPFKQKAYMLINLALGGMNGGSLSGTTFPQRYEIDYVRVFQKQ